MYILYGGKFTRAMLVEMVLSEGDLAYELREVDILKGGTRSSEILKINPRGLVPVLITPEGETLVETPAINLYLAERHKITTLVPEIGDPLRGQFLSGLFYITSHLEPALKRYWYAKRYGEGENEASSIRKRAYDEALECFRVIDKGLAEQGPFHLGDTFSLVDLMLAFWDISFDHGEVISDLPAVSHCVERVAARSKIRPFLQKQARWIREFEDFGAEPEAI
ncbi:MAG: glutathione S-transferase family protein [Kiloniellales bacterium]|nr:glutathione S-transferase family protein [Kiloniellales bacterium]